VHRVEKMWGYEFIPINNESHCLKFIFCEDNLWSSDGLYHMHIEKDESFFVVEGELELDVNGETFFLSPRQQKRIKPLTPHRFRSEHCQFLEVSTEDKPEDSIRGTLEDLHHRVRQYRETARTDSAGIFWN